MSVAMRYELYLSFTDEELDLIEDELMLDEKPVINDVMHWTIDLINEKLDELKEKKQHEKIA